MATLGSKFKSILGSLPWDKALSEENLAKYCQTGMFPELMRFLNKIELVRADSGLISATLTLAKFRDKVERGEVKFDDGTLVTVQTFGSIISILTIPRGKLYPSGPNKGQVYRTRYAGNVPLFLSVFKEFRNVKYKDWDLTDPKLELLTGAECMSMLKLAGTKIEWTSEQILDFSTRMRTAIKGGVANMNSYKTNTIGETDFDELHPHVKRLITQVWCFQPHIVSEFAIRNLEDIDAPAVPLVDYEILNTKIKTDKVEEIQW